MNDSVQQACSTLASQQRSNGSFAVMNQSGSEMVGRAARLSVHATLLDLLSQSSLPEIKQTIQRLAKYIADELQGEDFAVLLSQEDTRAVFHALASLHTHDATVLSPEVIAGSVRFLTTREVAPGGPYVNVLAHNNRPDRDTNCSIARFLYCLGGPFPALLRYALQTNKSQYFMIDWAVALQRQLLARVARQKIASVSYNDTVSMQCIDCFYQSFYAVDGQHYGSPAIAAARIISCTVKTSKKIAAGQLDQRSVLALARTALPVAEANNILARVVAADHYHEVGPLASRFAAALVSKRPTHRILAMLGAANLLNWAAYTMYDDMLDDESDDALLPAANTALRGSVRLFKEAVSGVQFGKLVEAHFDAVDAANAWELAYARFRVTPNTIRIGALPDYSDLRRVYERSLTHRLPMLGVFTAAGFSLNGRNVAALTEAFAQYLTIRQVSDDLHDWREDLRGGRVSYVVARVLADARLQAGAHTFSKLMPKLEHVFLHTTLPSIAHELLAIAEQARSAIDNARLLKPANVLSELIGAYEQSMRSVLSEQQNGLALLNVFPI